MPRSSRSRPLSVEVSHEGNQAQANEEVEAVFEIARSLLSGTTIDSGGRSRPLVPDDVLVVAPYNAQVAALQRRLSPVGIDRVGTVDRFQGSGGAGRDLFGARAPRPRTRPGACPSCSTRTGSTWQRVARRAWSSSWRIRSFSSLSAERRSRCGGRTGCAVIASLRSARSGRDS